MPRDSSVNQVQEEERTSLSSIYAGTQSVVLGKMFYTEQISQHALTFSRRYLTFNPGIVHHSAIILMLNWNQKE